MRIFISVGLGVDFITSSKFLREYINDTLVEFNVI